MTAGAWTPTNTTRTKILIGQFNWGSDIFKTALFQSISNISAASTTYAGVTNEIAAVNGYATGGVASAFTLLGTTTVAVSFTANPQWVASGGSIVARFGVIYEVGGDVAFYSLLDTTPADVTTLSGNSLTLDNDGSPNPVFQLA